MLFGLPFWISVLLGGGVVVIYSTVGGMWSLTLTDIVQFVIKTVGLMFVLLPICLYRVGGWDELVSKLPASNFSFTSIGWDTIITYFMIYFFGILIGQDIWQRVFTAKTAKVAKYAGTFAGFYCILYGLTCALIGMAAHVLIPDLDNVNNAFAAIVKVSLPDGIRGLVIAAALAAMMSTASAGLLAASTVLTEDLLPRLRGGKTCIVEAVKGVVGELSGMLDLRDAAERERRFNLSVCCRVQRLHRTRGCGHFLSANKQIASEFHSGSLHASGGGARIEGSNKIGCRQDFVGEGRAVQLMGGVHHFFFERGRSIAHQRDVITQLHRKAAC